MSAFLQSVINRAKQDKKTIVLPEGDDPRTLEAAERILADGIANLIILGDVSAIEESGKNLEGARIIDPKSSEYKAELANGLYECRKHKGMTEEKAAEIIEDVLYFGVMLVKAGMADGMVAGACHSTGDVLRPSLQILKTAPGAALVSSFFIMVVPDCEFGANGTFLFSDCGLEVQPDATRLANIAVSSAASFKSLVGEEPVVALLSHSSYGSAKNDDASKVVEAVAIAKELAPQLPVMRTCSYSRISMLATSAINSCSDLQKLKHMALLHKVLPRRSTIFPVVAMLMISMASSPSRAFRLNSNC